MFDNNLGVMGKEEGEEGKTEKKILGTNFSENAFGLNAKIKALGAMKSV